MKKREIKSKPIKGNRKKALIICVAVFLALVLIFGTVMIVISTVRNKNATVKYESLLLTDGVVSYLMATYKTSYMAATGATDDEAYWLQEYKDGVTYGDLLRRETEEYIEHVAVSAYLFDRYSSLTKDEKRAIKDATEYRLDVLADGNEEKFNQLAEKMGFDFSDFVEATEIMYKASKAKTEIYGEGGAVLKSGDYLGECEKYFRQYSHVKMLFIRTKTEFVTDENGNRVIGEDGRDKTMPLTAAQQEKRYEDIAKLDAAIKGFNENGDLQISPEMFDVYLEKYSYDKVTDLAGYYLSEKSEFCQEFATVYPDIMRAALELKLGDYLKLEYDEGICYIYKYENEAYAYTRSLYEDYFRDFYEDAADYLFFENVKVLSEDVEFRDGYYALDPVYIPYNAYLVARVEY